MTSSPPSFSLSPFLRAWLLVVLALSAAGLRAQELSILYGGTALTGLRSSTYAYAVDYNQQLFRNLSGSISWINEGHLPGHHRDGTAAELWLELPVFKERFTLSAGAGGYYYYDTQPTATGDSINVHGTAPILSLSATAYFADRWFARALYNRIQPRDNFHSDTLLLGVGYWFGRGNRPRAGRLGSEPEEKHYVTDNEFTVFTGTSVVNASGNLKGESYAAEYRRGLLPHLDGSVSFTYEGDPRIVRRSGVGVQVWPVNTFFNHRIAVGLGLGAYVYIDNKHLGPSRQLAPGLSVNTPAVAPLISPTFAVRLSESWLVRLMMHRVVTNYNRDSDVFLVGAGYRWR